ncbi:hypothetical protein [Paracraurococcus lichenis]|uniref:Uncharacterized protein n=1 Tax=Paracraurococcus lichenis TaxID=3064888 RepID=A0ABT9E6Q1_9PROT|nr:hypothetical protein [Paracraurococcus sp. LOR1-02]MDO9711660.1 hypothetical protein [Paracraurococcus sp. LOR1-02]
MISPHFLLRRCVPPVLAGLLLTPPALAEPDASPAQRLTGQDSRSVLPAEPGKLRWETPAGGLWIQGEASASEREPAPVAEPSFEHGAVALGAQRELVLLPHLSLAVAPQLRVEAAGDPHGLPVSRSLNGTMQQDLILTLPGEAKLLGSLGVVDRIGGLATGPSGVRLLRTRASLALPAPSAALPLKTELQVTTTRSLGAERGPDTLLSCELGLVVAWGALAPLRFAGSCPGQAERRVTLGISGTF